MTAKPAVIKPEISKWDVPSAKWEDSDAPWEKPTNSRLGLNYIAASRQFAKDWMGKTLTSTEFATWCAAQPTLAGRTDYNYIRRNIELAAYRDDAETPYDIEHVSKQAWIVRTTLEAFLTTPGMENTVKGMKEDLNLALDRLRAIHLDKLTVYQFSMLKNLFKTHRRLIRNTRLGCADYYADQQTLIADFAAQGLSAGAVPQIEN